MTGNSSKFNENFKFLKTTHSYHLVDVSLWPFVASSGAFHFTSGMVMYMHNYVGGWSLVAKSFILICYVMITWWRDVIREATFEESHSSASIRRSLRLGVILFIVSEVMFFFAFFWAFFHSSLSPSYNIGSTWPPKAIVPVDSYSIPLTNTLILLSSGATVTWSHHASILRSKVQTVTSLILTVALAVLFLGLQLFEYTTTPFCISDGVYGSCFYMATGFHGFHVFVGTVGLFFSLIRFYTSHFSDTQHFGFESCIWYWHFVDVVWLFLFIEVYYWANRSVSNESQKMLLSMYGQALIN